MGIIFNAVTELLSQINPVLALHLLKRINTTGTGSAIRNKVSDMPADTRLGCRRD